jgi:FkbM family methyltransferase
MILVDTVMFDSFLDIQRRLKPAISIEVGAYDAQFSRYMGNIAPEVYAFEANFSVYARYRDLPKMTYQHLAISDIEGYVDFEVQADKDILASNNSIMIRNDSSPKIYTSVKSNTLNNLFPDKKDIALWIDCEGANKQVLTGADKILPYVDSIFIEVEREFFWKDQWLEDDVKSYLNDFGFVLFLSKDQYVNQANQIYVRKEYIMPTPEGEITTSSINKPEEKQDDLQPLPDSSGVQPKEEE